MFNKALKDNAFNALLNLDTALKDNVKIWG